MNHLVWEMGAIYKNHREWQCRNEEGFVLGTVVLEDIGEPYTSYFYGWNEKDVERSSEFFLRVNDFDSLDEAKKWIERMYHNQYQRTSIFFVESEEIW